VKQSYAGTILIGIVIVISARAQKLEVAAIKPHATGSECSDTQLLPGGRLVASCFTLDMVIREALNVLPNQLTGGPKWVRHDLWDITAKAEGGSGYAEDEVYRALLRAVAAECFHLKLRSEKRRVKGLALVVARKGKLGPALVLNKDAPHRFDVKPGASLFAQKVTISDLAAWLKLPVGGGRKLEDKTGLRGEYDFVLKWTPLRVEEVKDKSILVDAPTIFTALRDQLGLEVRPDKVQEDFYVIENAQRPDID
jgi:uncharacterized protein (TIGR03435 family)